MKMNHCAALIIGRGGSSMKDKNIRMVKGHPLLGYPAMAAKGSRYIGRYFVSSDADRILDAAAAYGFTPIKRPDRLATPDAQSSDVVFHAVGEMELEGPVRYLVVLHANVGTISTAMIDECLAKLIADENLSAVVPSHEKNEYHPYRASFVNADGTLTSLSAGKGGVSANRQSLPQAVFFDHSFWTIDLDHVRTHGLGDGPWPCMGTRISPLLGYDCFDVHDEEDILRTETWLTERGLPLPGQTKFV
jgi:CMP-N-acetylneuraminic acid synthetase